DSLQRRDRSRRGATSHGGLRTQRGARRPARRAENIFRSVVRAYSGARCDVARCGAVRRNGGLARRQSRALLVEDHPPPVRAQQPPGGVARLMSLGALRLFAQNQLSAWRTLRLGDLQYWHLSETRLTLLALGALVVVLLIGRSAIGRRPGRHRLLVPAVLA